MPYIRVPKLSGSHPLVLDDAVQVRLRWLLNDVVCLNVLGGKVAGGFINSQTHANDLWDAVKAAFASSGMQACISDTNYLSGLDIRDIREANQVAYEATADPAQGTNEQQPLPNQLANVITLRTALAGKSYRGRIYFSGAGEDQNSGGGGIALGFRTACVDFVTGIKAAMSDEGIQLAVLSQKRYLNLPPPADLESWGGHVEPVVTGGIIARDGEWDTQRRRKH